MFETLISPFDGSDTGADGLALSTALAKLFGSRVIVIYVYEEALSAESSEAASELLRHSEAVLDGARERMSPVLATSFRAVAASSPASGISELAGSERAELIVIGSRRLGPRTASALGAVSEELIGTGRYAVAVATRGYRNQGGVVPRSIGVGWNAGDESERALEVAHQIARASAGSVDLVIAALTSRVLEGCVARARQTIESLTGQEARHVPIALHARVGDVSEELISRSRDLDLLVLGSRSHTASPAAPESVSSRVIAEAACPTMVLATD